MDRAHEGTLRAARHAGAGQHRPYRVARLRAAHQLGRGAPGGDREARHARALPMTRARARRGWPLAAMIASFFAGVGVDACLRTYGPPKPAGLVRASDDGQDEARAANAADSPRTAASDRPAGAQPTISATTGTTSRSLRVPIDGADVETWKGGFDERRGGGARGHEAVDILSARNKPVHAVVTGTHAKIVETQLSGH